MVKKEQMDTVTGMWHCSQQGFGKVIATSVSNEIYMYDCHMTKPTNLSIFVPVKHTVPNWILIFAHESLFHH